MPEVAHEAEINQTVDTERTTLPLLPLKKCGNFT